MKTLNDLQPRDTAYIAGRISTRSPIKWHEAIVTKVTPTQIVTVTAINPMERRWKKASGVEIPADGGFYRLRAECPDGKEGFAKSSIQDRIERKKEADKRGISVAELDAIQDG